MRGGCSSEYFGNRRTPGVLACSGDRPPWACYGQAAYGSPPPSAEAAFRADFSALHEGRFTTLLAGQGLVTIPSFHVVFAVLFTWVFRRDRSSPSAGLILRTFLWE